MDARSGTSPWVGYVAGLEAGELRFQRCAGCAAAVFHPRVACPVCGGVDLSWERSAGLGTVHSTTTVPVRDGDPYDVSLIDLDEGFRMMSRVEGVDPAAVEIGMRVELAVAGGDDGRVAVFRPARGVDGGGAADPTALRARPAVPGPAAAEGRGLRGVAAVVGVAESELGIVGAGLTEWDLIGQAATAALADAGLAKDDVDAVFGASSFAAMPTLHAAEYLGIRPRYSDATNLGGASSVAHLHHAAAAIAAGRIEVALIVYGSTQRSAGGFVTPSKLSPYEAPYRPRWPLTMYALAAARHMHAFGTTREQLAEVAVAARRWAQLNPKAFERGPLTVADVLAARTVSDPLTVRDCCLVTDGGGAVVVTSAERARTLRRPPAYLLGVGEAHWHRDISAMPDLTTTAATESSARAYAMAGLGPDDVDVVEVYDAFTINTILFLEDLGFCPKGEGGPFVADGRIAPGGELAVNTNGGGLSYCHPGMYGIFLVIEAVRQLRGEAGERQRNGADVALVHANGAVLSAQATALLGTESAL